MSLSPELRQRILLAARSEPALSRRQVVRQTLALVVVAVAVSLLAFLAAGGARSGGRPIALVLATTAGAVGIAVLTLGVALSRGPRMLGWARGWLVLAGVAAPLVFLAWKMGLSSAHDLAEPARPGYRCLALTLSLALAPLGALIFARRGSDPAHPRSLGLAIGIGVGMAAVALVDLWCPIGDPQHLLLGHVLPVAALGALGVWLGHRLLALRSR
jgi:hypothetical protein